jgi:4-carboxymuconolactone decarboxylase
MPPPVLDGHIRGALTLGDLSLAELREAALQLAVYTGWSRGANLDAAITRVADGLGLPPAPIPPIREGSWDPEARQIEGAANFLAVMTSPGPQPTAPYFADGILNFVFGEMWTRPGLDQRARRWVTLVGVAVSAMVGPIRAHVYSAMNSGDATPDEMNEFVLQYAVYGGWPTGSFLQGVTLEMAERVKQGLSFT